MKNASKSSLFLIVLLSLLVILLSGLLLFPGRKADAPSIDGEYQSLPFPDGSFYTAHFHKDQFSIQWHWQSQKEVILSGLFEPVDGAKGIYLLHDSLNNYAEVVVLQDDGFYIMDRLLNDILIFLQPIAALGS